MSAKQKKHQNLLNRFLCIAVLAVLAISMLAPALAHAQGASAGVQVPQSSTKNDTKNLCETGDLICHIRSAIGEVLVWVGLTAISIAGALLQFGAEAISFLFTLTKEIFTFEIVTRGFSAALGVVNLGFVLALILIAFATMLRYEEYGIKKLLPKLVIAVLLVNFSFSIAGVLIDFSNVISENFLTANGSLSTIGVRLADSIGAQKFILGQRVAPGTTVTGESSNYAKIIGFFGGIFGAGSGSPESVTPGANETIFVFNDWSSVLKMLVVVFFVLLLLTVAVIVFMAIALMVLIRLIALCILLVVMPVAWLGWATPRLTDAWSSWWSKFLKWNFVMPVVTFFIYLVVTAGNDIKNKVGASIGSSAKTLDSAVSIEGFTQTTLQAIVVLGLLVAGLIFAQSFGIAGAAAGINMARGARNRFLGAGRRGVTGTARLGGKAALGAAGTLGGRKLVRGGATMLSNVAGSRALRWIPGMRRASNALAGTASRKTEIEQRKGLYSNLSNDQVLNRAKTGVLPVNNAEKAALLDVIAERKLTKEFKTPEEIERLSKLADGTAAANPGMKSSQIHAIKELIEMNPHLAPQLTRRDEKPLTAEEATHEIPASKAFELSNDALSNTEVVTNLSQQQIININRNGSAEKVAKLRDALTGLLPDPTALSNISKNLVKVKQKHAEAKELNDTAEMNRLAASIKAVKANLKTLLQNANDEQRKAYDNLTHLDQAVGSATQ